HLAVDRTTMVALVDALERAGMVARRHDPADRRGRRVTLTRAGADALRAAHDAVASVEEEFLAPLTEAEQRQFRRLLAKLVLARA
ncbi:MAG: MarR family transcriptional regulator, partial [Solirubrobacteraceae bacterium]